MVQDAIGKTMGRCKTKAPRRGGAEVSSSRMSKRHWNVGTTKG
jgi:hypothetical protein